MISSEKKVEIFECQMCGKCCTRYPCALHPNDLPKIAKYLGLTEEETIDKYLVWDYWVGEGDLHYLCPKRKGDISNYTSYAWAFNGIPCIFLMDDNLCQIHEVKPLNGKQSTCKDGGDYSKKQASIAWKGHPLNSRSGGKF